MQYTGTYFVQGGRGEKQEGITGTKNSGKRKSPNLTKNSNSMVSPGLMNCEIPRKANGKAEHEQTKRQDQTNVVFEG